MNLFGSRIFNRRRKNASDQGSEASVAAGKLVELRSFFWTGFGGLLFGFLSVCRLELGGCQVAKR